MTDSQRQTFVCCVRLIRWNPAGIAATFTFLLDVNGTSRSIFDDLAQHLWPQRWTPTAEFLFPNVLFIEVIVDADLVLDLAS